MALCSFSGEHRNHVKYGTMDPQAIRGRATELRCESILIPETRSVDLGFSLPAFRNDEMEEGQPPPRAKLCGDPGTCFAFHPSTDTRGVGAGMQIKSRLSAGARNLAVLVRFLVTSNI